MIIKLLLLTGLFLFSFISVFANEIVITPLQVFSHNNSVLSGYEISAEIAGNNKYVTFSPSSGEIITSVIEASSYCDREGLDNLIFGFVTGDDLQISMELRYYNHKTRTVEAVFFAGDGVGEIERLIVDISEKMFTYFNDDPGHSELEPQDVFHRSIFSIPLSAGYWIPVDDNWNNFTKSIFSFSPGIQIDPFKSIIEREKFTLDFRFGFSLLYELAVNYPNYETFYLHKLKFMLPLTFCFQLLERHSLSAIIAPLVQMDILDKRRNYSDVFVDVTAALGFSAGIGYRYLFSDYFSGGLACSVDFVFFETVQVSIRPELSVQFHPGSFITGESE